jgi:acetyl esterase/lipase
VRDRPFPFSRSVANLRRVTLVADLRLRFGPTRLPARVYLPLRSSRQAGGAPLVIWCSGRNGHEVLCRELSAAATAVVLELGRRQGINAGGHEAATLGWAAEHARELGAHPDQLVVGGELGGAALAARLAVDARDCGWPVVCRQVLVRPAFSDSCPAPSDVAGTPPATIVTTGSRRDDGSRYAATLRDAGVDVRELISDARRALPLNELARGLQ